MDDLHAWAAENEQLSSKTEEWTYTAVTNRILQSISEDDLDT